MRITSALHWTLLVALLGSPVVASAQNSTDDQEPVASPPPTPNTTSEQSTESDVNALLEQLQPNIMVVDGDPIETMTLDELMAAVHYSAAPLKSLVERQVAAGQIIRLSPRLLLLPRYLPALQQLLERLQADANGGLFSVAQFRDASGIGRNRCIEILESLDARSITRRSGQGRCLLPRAQDQFARLQPGQ